MEIPRHAVSSAYWIRVELAAGAGWSATYVDKLGLYHLLKDLAEVVHHGDWPEMSGIRGVCLFRQDNNGVRLSLQD